MSNVSSIHSFAEIERFSYDPDKWFLISVRYLFYQPVDEKIKTWTLRFPAKENLNIKGALFDWPIVLQYDVKAYRLISRSFSGLNFFSPECSLNQPKATHVCIRSINQWSLVLSVLFARFHFKVIPKSLYHNFKIIDEAAGVPR